MNNYLKMNTLRILILWMWVSSWSKKGPGKWQG